MRRPLRPIDPHELAVLTGDTGAVPPRLGARHLDADDMVPRDPPPSWAVIAGAALVVIVVVPLFLAWCGSLRL